MLIFTTKSNLFPNTVDLLESVLGFFSVHCFNLSVVLFCEKTRLALPTRQLRHAQRLHTL
jgi:hypothetical protein